MDGAKKVKGRQESDKNNSCMFFPFTIVSKLWKL